MTAEECKIMEQELEKWKKLACFWRDEALRLEKIVLHEKCDVPISLDYKKRWQEQMF